MGALGRMTKSVDFSVFSGATTATGGRLDTFTPLLTCFGELVKTSGRRQLETGQQFANKWVLRVHWQALLEANMNTKLKVEIEGKTYRIESFELKGEKRFYYELILAESGV